MIGQIKAEEGCVWVRTVQDTLKEGGTESRWGKTKILKRQSKLGQVVGALKRRGLESPYELWCYTQHDYSLPLLEIQWNLYTADIICAKKSVCFIQIFSKIVWPQSKALHSLSYCLSYGGVCFIVCLFIEIPLYEMLIINRK